MIAATVNKTNFVSVKINNVVVWFSYGTPVVVQYNGEKVATAEFFSTTTSRHINSTGAQKDQARFDALIKKIEAMNG